MPDIDFQRIELNLIPKKGDEPVVFYASQYETARPFIADLKWGDSEFVPGVDCRAEIDIRKNDDNLVVITDDVSIDNNEVSVILPVQAVTCIGKNLGQVKIYAADDQLIAALNFILEVQADPLAGGVTSETAIDNLTTQIEAIVPEVIGDDYYNKTEVDALLADKADVSDLPDMSLYYTKTATDTLLNAKADKSDTYTKAQVDTALSAKANTADLATVATSGDYDDLINKPTIPAAQIQSDYTQADTTAVDYIKNKPDINAMIAAAIMAIMPVETQTGNPCSFDTDIATELQGLTADIVSSGGGGTPSTPIPIVGHSELNLVRCGVNIWNEQWEFGIWTSNGTKSPTNDAIRSKNYIAVTPNSTIYLVLPFRIIIRELDENKDVIKTITPTESQALTLSATTKYIVFCTYSADNITTYSDNISFNYPSTDTSYHAYNGDTFTVSFGQTVYGGVYDANRGVLKITHGRVNLGDLNYTYDANIPLFFCISNIDGKSNSSNAMCEIYNNGGQSSASNLPDKSFRFIGWQYNNSIWIKDTNYTSVDDFKTAILGHYFVYELATPIEIDVSELSVDTIVGVNNIVSDCGGDVEVEYRDSIQHYIDKKIAETQALIL